MCVFIFIFISARVMRDENGGSRGFGFVSYQTPDQGTRRAPEKKKYFFLGITNFFLIFLVWVGSHFGHARYERCSIGIKGNRSPST